MTICDPVTHLDIRQLFNPYRVTRFQRIRRRKQFLNVHFSIGILLCLTRTASSEQNCRQQKFAALDHQFVIPRFGIYMVTID